ncbi:MAG: nucleotidyl transferase AbiEii/AbiGii toxin family protein, partial [bacterium]
PQVRRAFVVYLASHDRPMHELLDPQFKDIAKVHVDEFAGMAREEVPVETLCETRKRIVVQLRETLDADEKRFLLSMKRAEPEWDALGIAHLRELPALQWKLQNIRRMTVAKRQTALEKLQKVLGA